MSRKSKWPVSGAILVKRFLQFAFLLLLTFIIPSAKATTYTATDCTQPNVQAAVNSAAVGDNVVIPACAQTNWTSAVHITKCIEVKGSGQGLTTIGDNVTKDGTQFSMAFYISVSCGTNVFKLHDFTLIGVAVDTNVYSKGHINLSGSGNIPGGFRIYNITASSMQTSFASVNWVGPGLFDHLTAPNCGGSRGEINFKASSWGGGSYGDGSWSDPSPLPGSANQIYIEDSTWTCSGGAPSQVVDGDSGARWVFRFNTVTGGNMVNHGTDTSQRERSGRWQEYYQDKMMFSSTAAPTPPWLVWFRGGSGIQWGIPVSGVSSGNFGNLAQALNCRSSGASCGGSPWNPWGICNGSGVYDQNSSNNGYKCVDQPGTGTSNAVSGATPSPASWVGNISQPIYIFGMTGVAPSNGVLAGGPVQQDRDYFTDFGGSQGVRTGTFANIPPTCNAGQGYWATDQGSWNHSNGVNATGYAGQGQLYTCGSSNNWTLYYTPYTYPHPLVGTSGSPPAPPTGLAAIVN